MKMKMEAAAPELDRRFVLYNEAGAWTQAEPSNMELQVAVCTHELVRASDAHPDDEIGRRQLQDGSDFTRSSPEESERDQKAKLESASKELDRRVVLYNEAGARAQAEPNNAELKEEYTHAAENVAAGMHEAADAHPDEQTRKDWHEKADKFRDSSPDERDNALRDIGKGLLMIIATPFVLAGLALYAAGTIVGGVGSILKGIGRFGELAFKKARQNGF